LQILLDKPKAVWENVLMDESLELAERIYFWLGYSNIGLTRSEISKFLNHHTPSQDIEAALSLLLASGLSVFDLEPTAGRPREIWRNK